MRERERAVIVKQRFTVYLHGEAAARLDAMAYRIWDDEGRSTPKPEKTEALRRLLLGLEATPARETRTPLFRCARCGRLFGAPHCADHEADHIEPVELFAKNKEKEK